MDLYYYYDPILMLQHMLRHEGYQSRSDKLALKAAGRPLADKEAGRTRGASRSARLERY
jgi:hypothetical protein